MPTVDSLDIEIQAQAQKATTSLNAMITKLDGVSAAMNRINSGNLTGLANGVNRLSSSMQAMKSVGTADFTRLATNIQKIGAIDTASINRAASAITQMSKGFAQLSTVNTSGSAAQMIELANGIKRLGYKSVLNAVDNIPKLATAMKELMTTLSTAPMVSQNLINMTNALAKLARTGASSGKAATSLGKSLDVFSASSSRATKSSFSLASAIGKVYATYWLLFRAFGKIKEAIDISSDLTEVQNVVDVTFGDMAYKVENLAKTSIEQFGMSELSLKQYASRFQAMGSAMGISSSQIAAANKNLSSVTDGYVGMSDSMADVSLNLTKLTADMASFYNVEQADVAEDLAAIFTGMTRPLRTYGLDLTEATLSEWAMKNGLDANIESMTQAEKTMLRYQYVLANTGAAQGDFARNADTWANQVRILKQNFEQLASVIGGTLINALKPLVKALNTAMGYVIRFAQTVSDALGKIFGWTYEPSGGGVASDMEDAADGASDLSDGIGDSAKNAKKLKNVMSSIDQLNILSYDNGEEDSSGSGTGTSSGAGYDNGQWSKTKSMFEEFESEIDTLFELGEHIRDSLIGAMENIDWESVYEKAKNFGKGLAEFLNGLFAGENGKTLFGEVGRTIASALNTAIYAALSFGEEFDFEQFGQNIADGINNFFATFDFTALAETLNTWVDGLRDTLKKIIEETDWKAVFEGIKDFFKELDIDTIIIVAGGMALKYGAIPLTASLFKKIVLSKLGISSGFLIGATVIIGIQFIEGAQKWIENIINWGWEEGRKKSADKESNPYRNGGNTAQEGGALDIMWKKNHDKQEEWLNKMVTSVKEKAKEIENAWNNTSFQKWRENNKNVISAWWTEDVFPWFTAEKWSKLWENVKTSFSTKWSEIVAWWKNSALVKWWTEDVFPWFTKEKWLTLFSNIKISLSETWNNVVIWWKSSALYKWYEENVKPWFDKSKWNFSGIKDGLKLAFDAAVEAVKKIWNTFATWLNSKLKFDIEPIKIMGKTIFEGVTVDLGKLPTYATGGFPEDGLFMANHSELVGQFSNGRTAVVNNEQILEGIKGAFVDGMMEVVMATSSQAGNSNDNRPIQIVLDGRVIAESTYSQFSSMARQGLIPKMI